MAIDERTAQPYTSCENCLFAVWNDNQQSGCELNRIEKFKENYEVTYDYNEDTDKYHYTIETVCNACGPSIYKDTVIDAKQKILEVIKIKCDIILLCFDGDDLINELTQKALEIKKQFIRPQKVICVIKDLNYIKVHDILSDILLDVEIDVVQIADWSKDDLECIDLAFKRCKSTYYIVLKIEKEFNDYFIDMLNNLINTEMKPMSLVIGKDNDIHGMVVQSIIHKVFRGNNNMPIYEKINLAFEEQTSDGLIFTDLIYNLEDLCQNYQK